jgi:hypothetical protein
MWNAVKGVVAMSLGCQALGNVTGRRSEDCHWHNEQGFQTCFIKYFYVNAVLID